MLLLDKLRAARSLQILPPAVRTGNQVKGACYVARRRHEGGGLEVQVGGGMPRRGWVRVRGRTGEQRG